MQRLCQAGCLCIPAQCLTSTLAPAQVIKADIQADTSVPADERNYSDFVRAIDPALVGAPHFYVSHAWGSVFANTVSDVQNFVQMWMADRFEPDPNDPDSWQERVYVWVDVLCRKPKQDAAAVVQEARHAIAWASELTLASIDDDCDVFQLAWMQYEAWCTAEVKGADKLRLLCPQVRQRHPCLACARQSLSARTTS